jgi:excisionase family DNA binding protein
MQKLRGANMTDSLAFLSEEVRVALETYIVERIEAAVERRLAGVDAACRASESPFLTIREASELLRCRRQRIDDLLSSGRLTRVKEGRRTLIARLDIEAHLLREDADGN